ncbi:MAG: family 20 glycosylhydrolase [Planctomycetota bacterium]|jgi:hypothetical protein
MTNKIFGFMFDAARQPESIATYKHMIDFLSDWNYNTILFRVCDDQGIAVKLDSHPEFKETPDSFSKDEIKDLVRYAESKGIDIIPEIESFGHTKYIATLEQYKEISEVNEETGLPVAICPVAELSLSLMQDIYSEITEVFTSKYIHGGCDEVRWGSSEASQKALESKSRIEIWGKHINSLYRIAADLGKEFMIWGDHALRKEPEILDHINKEIIIVDWEYKFSRDDEILPAVENGIEKGFSVVGAPAVGWGKWLIRTGSMQLKNIDAHIEANKKTDTEKGGGVIVTHWCPWRFLADSYYDTLAYSSISFHEGFIAAKDNAFKLFVEKHYGAEWDNEWKKLFSLSHLLMLPRWKSSNPLEYPFIAEPWHNKETLEKAKETPDTAIPDLEELLELLDVCEAKVNKNKADYEAFKISYLYYENIYSRITAVKNLYNEKDEKEAFKAVAEKDKYILKLISDQWDKTRNTDSKMKFKEAPYNSPGQDIWVMMKMAADYSASLVTCEKE